MECRQVSGELVKIDGVYHVIFFSKNLTGFQYICNILSDLS